MKNFSLGALMITVSLAACCIWLSRETWLVGVLFAFAIVQAVVAIRLRKRAAVWLVTRATLGISAVIAAWFAIVDKSDVSWQCTKCDYCVVKEVFRLGGVGIWTDRSTVLKSTVSRIHEDLGYPCEHTYQSEVLERNWGLVALPKPQYISCCIPPPPIYGDSESTKAREFSRKHLAEAREVLREYAHSGDFQVIDNFILKLKYGDW